MFRWSAFVFFSFIGILGARQPDIDINRVRLIPRETSSLTQQSPHNRRSIERYQVSRTNDYDDLYNGHVEPRPFHDGMFSTKTPIKIHQPREDPRLFYQSSSYLQDKGNNVNHEVTFIYPGREVIRAGENDRTSLAIRKEDIEVNGMNEFKPCVRCPHDRTLIAKGGSDQVVLQYPRLFACSGQKAPRNARFVHMYGPKFGFLLEHGSHMVVGRIMYKNTSLQLCKMQVYVVVQGCPTPKYLVSHCGERYKPCNFTCRDRRLELHGRSSTMCGNNMKWTADLPTCRVRTSCERPPLPEHGRVSCKGATAAGADLAEGSKCRVRCARGWRGSARAAVCRRGAWTHALACHPKRST